MPENLIVTEGGVGRRFGVVSRIITDDASDGNDTWVPVSDRITLNKYITENGTYYAEDDDLYAYSKLTVNILGAPTMPEIPTEAVDEFGQETPTGATGPNLPQTMGGIGSSIVGIDPDTGNYCVASVRPNAASTNGMGTIEKKEIPTKLHILTLPPSPYDTFAEGARITAHGLLVELQKEDGTRFTDERFSDGTILWNPVEWQGKPWEEEMIYDNLALDPTVAPSISEIATRWGRSTFSDIQSCMPIPIVSSIRTSVGTFTPKSWSVGLVVVRYRGMFRDNNICLIDATDTRNSETYRSFTYAGKTVYYYITSWINSVSIYSGQFIDHPSGYGSGNDSMENHIAWTMVYGDVQCLTDVDVKWKSPYDGNTYKTEMEIKVIGADSTAGGSGGSSTSGGGGGGGGNGGGGAG